jgi:hypothetical protein
MKKFFASMAVMAAVAAGAVVGQFSNAAEVESGLAAGQRVPAFYVHDVTGPQKGEDLCYRCRFGSQPVISIFTKDMDDNVAKLTKAVDGVIAQNRDAKMAGFLVLTSDSPSSAEAKLAEVATKHSIKQVPLTTFEGSAGPKSYKLNPAAEVTVMMWVEGKVKVNKGFAAKDLTDETIAAITKDASKILE